MKLFNIKKKTFWFWLAVLILFALLIYFFTYFFAKDHKKVIYEKNQRRIYLLERKKYGNKDREMWRMVYEDMKTGNRSFVLGNSPKGFSEDKMAAIVINTIEQGKTKSFDQVERTGITMRAAKTDIHSNMIDKKGLGDIFGDMTKQFEFETSVNL